MGGEISDRKSFKGTTANDRTQCGKVFSQRAEYAEPILAVIDFETLEGGEAAVRSDEGSGNIAHSPTVGCGAAHVLIGGERLHHGCGHFALDGFEGHCLRAHRTAPAGSATSRFK